MADRKIVGIEYKGQSYPPTRAQLAKLDADPLVDSAAIVVTYEAPNEPSGKLRIRPFRFSSNDVSFAPDGTAKVY